MEALSAMRSSWGVILSQCSSNGRGPKREERQSREERGKQKQVLNSAPAQKKLYRLFFSECIHKIISRVEVADGGWSPYINAEDFLFRVLITRVSTDGSFLTYVEPTFGNIVLHPHPPWLFS